MSWRVPAGPTAIIETPLRLTLIILLLRPMGPWYVRVLLLLLATLGLIAPAVARAPATWLALALLVGARILLDWPLPDNHIYLLGYWCLALALALRDAAPAVTIARSSRLLIGLAFLCAVMWKAVLSPDYLDGRFFRVTLLNDDRFADVVKFAGGLDDADLDETRAYLTPLPEGAALLDPPVLHEPAGLRWLARVATWGGLALEAIVAALFLWPRPTRVVSRCGHAAVLLFCAATYALAPVAGFGWLLLAMGLASSDPSDPRDRVWRRAYIAVFLLVMLYAEFPRSRLPVGTVAPTGSSTERGGQATFRSPDRTLEGRSEPKNVNVRRYQSLVRFLPNRLMPMPNVVLKTVGDDGQEEQIVEYLCDWPECVNTATQVIGLVVELRAAVVACPEHAALLESRAASRTRR